MPVVSITRVRIRSWRYVPQFFYFTIRARLQAARAPGNGGGRLLREPGNIYWTATLWDSEEAIRHFMISGAHGKAMRHLMIWCNESALVRWTQDTPTLPTWQEAHRRLTTQGRRSKVLHPTPAHTPTHFEIPAPKI